MKKLYEIHDLTTAEILADNLNFEDMPELLGAYADFYPTHEIIACYRNCNNDCKKIVSKRADFKVEWFNLLEENIANFY